MIPKNPGPTGGRGKIPEHHAQTCPGPASLWPHCHLPATWELGDTVALSITLAPKHLTGRRTASPVLGLCLQKRSPASGRLGTGATCVTTPSRPSSTSTAHEHSRTAGPTAVGSAERCTSRRGSLSVLCAAAPLGLPTRKLVAAVLPRCSGHARVYFGHLKEVHGVWPSVPSPPLRAAAGDLPRTPCQVEGLVERYG